MYHLVIVYRLDYRNVQELKNTIKYLSNKIDSMKSYDDKIKMLLSTIETIKRCYAYYDDKNIIEHGGFIYGDNAKSIVEYTDKFKIKNVSISLCTCTKENY